MPKRLLIYAVTLLVFGAGIFAVLERGQRLETARAAAGPPAAAAPETATTPGALENLRHPLPLLLLQLITIVLAARLFGALLQKIGQPPVIGEIVAAIVLGPSLLGAVAPGVFGFSSRPLRRGCSSSSPR